MTWIYLIVSFIFLTGSVREVVAYEPFIECAMFIGLCVSMFQSWKSRAVWIAYFSYIIALYYNPYFLVVKNVPNSHIADILIGISFFFISLRWYRYKESVT